MAIDELISGLDAHLTDERVHEAAPAFLTAIDRRLEYDTETGTMKIIFNLAGEYIDEVYSRANVVDE